MRTIFLDSDFKCYVNNDGSRTAIETDFFDGKCDTYIEGYRFVPAGKIWGYGGGVYIYGEAVMPWKEFKDLQIAQEEYELVQIKEYRDSLKILGVSL